MEIKEVDGMRDMKKFIMFQYSLYRDNPYWVPPLRSDEFKSLRPDQNPAFDFCDARYWLAYKGDKVVGRIAGIINKKYNERWCAQAARFGWLDFVDDREVSSALLSAAETWARQNGMKTIHGPLGFTDMDGEGLLIEGFEEVSTLGALYNYPYYAGHVESAGYCKDADWVEYEVQAPTCINEEVARIADIALQRNKLRVLHVKNPKELLPYAKEVFYVLNAAYKDLYGFVELSDRQIDLYVKQYFGYIIPDYVPIVLDSDNKVAAFGITMPSLSRALQKNKGKLFPLGFIPLLRAMKKNPKADLYLTAVRPDLQNKGVNAILIRQVAETFIKHGIKTVETNRELEGNAKVQAQWKFFDRRQHKRRRCYKKELV